MPEDGQRDATPFTAFNFLVEIVVDGNRSNAYTAGFAECDGLEMNMQVKTLREGGNNTRPIHLTGPVTYGQLSLKRGMTSNFELWTWFKKVQKTGSRGYRVDIDVLLRSSDFQSTNARFTLRNCLPVKLKAPALNAREGMVAIEEMQVAYESLVLEGVEE